jgi:hypothetical protein
MLGRVVGKVKANTELSEEEGADKHARYEVGGNGGESNDLCHSREKKSRD